MTVPRPANSPARDPKFTRAVDIAGQVWRHHNPAELYRFIRSRNELLKAIGASRRAACV
jgi:hypothetical protein